MKYASVNLYEWVPCEYKEVTTMTSSNFMNENPNLGQDHS